MQRSLALAFTLCFCLVTPAWAQSDVDSAADTLLSTLANTDPARSPPVWQGLAEVTLADTADTKTFQLSDGCRFHLDSQRIPDAFLAAWSGSRCDGDKLLTGQGELRLSWHAKDARLGDLKIFSRMKGYFQDGYLTGAGERHLYVFSLTGTRIEEFIFSGNLNHNQIEGLGTMIHIRPVGEMPSAIGIHGHFISGLPHDLVIVARINPRPGVDRDAGDLVLDDNAQPYLLQSGQKHRLASSDTNPNAKATLALAPRRDVLWTTYYRDSPHPWRIYVDAWTGDAVFGRAGWGTLSQNVTDNGREIDIVATCKGWEEQLGSLRCSNGAIEYATHEETDNAHFVAKQRDIPFDILPSREIRQAVRVTPGQTMLVYAGPRSLTDISAEQRRTFSAISFPMQCSENLDRCDGAQWIRVGGNDFYWRGQARIIEGRVRFPLGEGKVRQGKLVPTGADDGHSFVFIPEDGMLFATCESINEEAVCAHPIFDVANTRFSGGILRVSGLLAGKALDSSSATQTAFNARVPLQLSGWWRQEYSNGSWAQVRLDTNAQPVRILEIGLCGRRGEDKGSRTCILRADNTIKWPSNR